LATLTEKYGQPLLGSRRAVYDLGDGWMLKVPYTWDGVTANYTEGSWGGENAEFMPLAECTVDDRNRHGLPLLRMRKVNPDHGIPSRELPEWVGWVDCQQVGVDDSGRLVAYDL
jgi:hypothetical protein